MTTANNRLRARIAEALGIYPAEQDVDAILRACLEAVEELPRANAAGHCIGKTLVRYADLRALFTGGAAKP